MRYLIAETNWTTVSLAHDLAHSGFPLTRVEKASDAEDFLGLARYDCAILDAGLMGVELSLRALKARGNGTPICLIARRPTPVQARAWLDAGADSVIDDAEDNRTILAAAHAVARRNHGLATSQFSAGKLRINLLDRDATIAGEPLKLSPKVFELLEFLALRHGTLVTRDALLTHLYELGEEPDPRVFDVFMHSLRRSLKPASPDVAIETARGKGFRFMVRASRSPEPIAA